MKPILFDHNETDFKTNGIGALSDAVSCKVDQALNGKYELTMQYPVKGLHFGQIKRRSVILAKVDPVSALQPFRVYRITKPSKGIVTVYARHIVYDLAGILVTPFSAKSASEALLRLPDKAVEDCPFSFHTNKSDFADFSVAVPTAIWPLLGGAILDAFGGEYAFDRWDVTLLSHRGADRGVSIRYGKNLTTLEQDENCANCYTGVLPYWVDRETGAVTMLPEKIVPADGTFPYTKHYPLDLSGEFKEAPSAGQLRASAKDYMDKNKICEPVVSWKIEFVPLEQTAEYKNIALLEQVYLGDTVEVVFEQLGIAAKARAVSCRYDSLLERFDYIYLGSVKRDITDTIVEQKKELNTKPGKKEMRSAVELITSTILGARGGSVRFLDEDGDGEPDTLYIADSPDPTLAVKVWRFNYEGWGASDNGYNGPFELGATLDDGLLASFVTAAHLIAGTIQSEDGETFYLDLDNGILKGQFNELHISGKTVDEIAGTVAQKAVDTSLGSYAETVTKDLNSLQAQIDGQIQTWFYSYLPTPSNAPAAEWGTEELKNKHLGDLFYVVDNDTHGGLVYRWALINGVYQWVLVEDVEVAKALADAAKAQDTADGKRRVFVAQPSPPYDKGDLWAQGANGDLMRCKTSKAAGASFASSDWELASKYIDSATAGSIAQGKVNAQTQTDIFNKLTDNGTLPGLFMQNGQLYVNASYIKTGELLADLIKTGIMKSNSGLTEFDVDNGRLVLRNHEVFGYVKVEDGDIDLCHPNGQSVLKLWNLLFGGAISFLHPDTGKFLCSMVGTNTGFALDLQGEEHELQWQDNSDGTFTLIGI